jgi:hypothetical protein
MSIIKRVAPVLLLIFITTSPILPTAASAQKKLVPVVDVGGGGCVMGGVSDGKWVESEAMAALMKGGERYNLYSLTRKLGERTGTKPVSEGAPCESTMYVKDLAGDAKGEKELIAVGGDWNALPRVPKVESTSSLVYRTAVADLLRRNGIRRPQVNITSVLRVDLEGDGTEEVLISATRVKRWQEGGISAGFDAGDYSVVLLRKLINGKVETIVLNGEYHTRARDTSNDPPPNEYKVAAVLDLNGDGRMEVIVQGGYYEGDWKTVYSINGRKVENLFGCGCGA